MPTPDTDTPADQVSATTTYKGNLQQMTHAMDNHQDNRESLMKAIGLLATQRIALKKTRSMALAAIYKETWQARADIIATRGRLLSAIGGANIKAAEAEMENMRNNYVKLGQGYNKESHAMVQRLQAEAAVLSDDPNAQKVWVWQQVVDQLSTDDPALPYAMDAALHVVGDPMAMTKPDGTPLATPAFVKKYNLLNDDALKIRRDTDDRYAALSDPKRLGQITADPKKQAKEFADLLPPIPDVPETPGYELTEAELAMDPDYQRILKLEKRYDAMLDAEDGFDAGGTGSLSAASVDKMADIISRPAFQEYAADHGYRIGTSTQNADGTYQYAPGMHDYQAVRRWARESRGQFVRSRASLNPVDYVALDVRDPDAEAFKGPDGKITTVTDKEVTMAVLPDDLDSVADIPTADEAGGAKPVEFAATDTAAYMRDGDAILKLDPDTGEWIPTTDAPADLTFAPWHVGLRTATAADFTATITDKDAPDVVPYPTFDGVDKDGKPDGFRYAQQADGAYTYTNAKGEPVTVAKDSPYWAAIDEQRQLVASKDAPAPSAGPVRSVVDAMPSGDTVRVFAVVLPRAHNTPPDALRVSVGGTVQTFAKPETKGGAWTRVAMPGDKAVHAFDFDNVIIAEDHPVHAVRAERLSRRDREASANMSAVGSAAEQAAKGLQAEMAAMGIGPDGKRTATTTPTSAPDTDATPTAPASSATATEPAPAAKKPVGTQKAIAAAVTRRDPATTFADRPAGVMPVDRPSTATADMADLPTGPRPVRPLIVDDAAGKPVESEPITAADAIDNLGAESVQPVNPGKRAAPVVAKALAPKAIGLIAAIAARRTRPSGTQAFVDATSGVTPAPNVDHSTPDAVRPVDPVAIKDRKAQLDEVTFAPATKDQIKVEPIKALDPASQRALASMQSGTEGPTTPMSAEAQNAPKAPPSFKPAAGKIEVDPPKAAAAQVLASTTLPQVTQDVADAAQDNVPKKPAAVSTVNAAKLRAIKSRTATLATQ